MHTNTQTSAYQWLKYCEILYALRVQLILRLPSHARIPIELPGLVAQRVRVASCVEPRRLRHHHERQLLLRLHARRHGDVQRQRAEQQ